MRQDAFAGSRRDYAIMASTGDEEAKRNLPVAFCGRVFVHRSHIHRKNGSPDVRYEAWPEYYCAGYTAEQAKAALLKDEPEDSEEVKLAKKIARLHNFIQNPNNWIDPFEPAAVRVSAIKAILESEE